MFHSKRNVLILVCLFCSGFIAFAQQASIKTSQVKWTSPTSGHAMYQEYCAVCHGTTGKGNGPLASQLKAAPTDLTLLAKENGGKYPAPHVVSVLRFGASSPSHGTAEMPVWGPVLRSLNRYSDPESVQRTNNLSHYLQTLQVK